MPYFVWGFAINPYKSNETHGYECLAPCHFSPCSEDTICVDLYTEMNGSLYGRDMDYYFELILEAGNETEHICVEARVEVYCQKFYII